VTPLDSSFPPLYALKGLAIYSRRSLVRSDKIMGMAQDIQPVNLVIEKIESVLLFLLGLCFRLPFAPPSSYVGELPRSHDRTLTDKSYVLHGMPYKSLVTEYAKELRITDKNIHVGRSTQKSPVQVNIRIILTFILICVILLLKF
jgi:hypothetical protein